MKRIVFLLAILAVSLQSFAQVKVSALPAATTPLAGTELSVIVQGGITKKVSVSAFGTGGGGTIDSGIYVTITRLRDSLALKGNIASPAFTGVPLAPTASPGTNTTQIASTAFVFAGLATKQATLVSATNIKTINGSSILGSGDLSVVGAANTDALPEGSINYYASAAHVRASFSAGTNITIVGGVISAAGTVVSTDPRIDTNTINIRSTYGTVTPASAPDSFRVWDHTDAGTPYFGVRTMDWYYMRGNPDLGTYFLPTVPNDTFTLFAHNALVLTTDQQPSQWRVVDYASGSSMLAGDIVVFVVNNDGSRISPGTKALSFAATTAWHFRTIGTPDTRLSDLVTRRRLTEGTWTPGGPTDHFTVTKHGTTYGVRTGGGFWFTGSADLGTFFLPVVAADTFTLPPQYALTLDVGVQPAVWTVEMPTAISNSFTKIIVFQNSYGGDKIIQGPNASFLNNTVFVDHSLDTVIHNLTIKVGGTPGVDCDYTSISRAYIEIQSGRSFGVNSATNQYILNVLNGTYIEGGQDTVNLTGINPKDFINIIGESRNGVIIKNLTEGSSGPAEAGYSTFTPEGANCYIKNCTIRAYKAKYCFHLDGNCCQWNMLIENCNLEHYGGAAGGYGYDVGCGFRPGQNLTIRNCTMTGLGMFCHGGLGGTTNVDNINAFHLEVANCNMNQFYFVNHAEYSPNTIKITNSVIKDMQLHADTSWYSGSGNPLINRGYLAPPVMLQEGGNKYYTLTIDGEFRVMNGGRLPTLVNFNEYAANNTGSTITAGHAVKVLVDPSFTPAYPSSNLLHHEIDICGPSASLYGFAMEDIVTATLGPVQMNGTPQAYFNNSGGSVAYGDALELNSSGEVVKHSTGEIVGYALAAASSSGLTAISLKK